MDLLKNYGLLAAAGVVAIVGLTTLSGGYELFAFLGAALLFCAQVIVASPRNGTVATAALAAGSNAYLLSRKFSASGDAACNINQTINCDIVNTSAASELFGIPITLFGLGFYGGLFIAGLIADKKDPRFDQINGLFALVTLAYSVYLGWEAKQIGAFCVVCFTIYAANALLLWAALAALKAHDAKLFAGIDRLFGTSALWTITAVFAVTTLVGSSMWGDRKAQSPSAFLNQPRPSPSPGASGAPQFSAEQLRTLYARPQGTIELDGTEPVFGRPDAPITIVEFADYGCPHCATAMPEVKRIVSTYPQVQLRFKAFPFSGACNPLIEGQDQIERCKAAMAAECAGEQGLYFELSSMLFTNLNNRSDDDIAFMAGRVAGLDTERWAACVNNPATVDAVRADALAGMKAGVQSTPSFFVNGLVPGAWIEVKQGPAAIQALVEAKIDGMELLAP